MREGTVTPNGNEVERLRTERGWSQEEMAKKADCSKRTIENIEGGRPVYRKTLAAIAAAFGPPVQVKDLLGGSDEGVGLPGASTSSETAFRGGNSPPLQSRLGECDEELIRTTRHLSEVSSDTMGTSQSESTAPLDLYSDVPASLRDAICDAGPFIETWTRGFVGREFVVDALDRFLEDSRNPSGYFVVRGEPGIGKSAFMAHLVKTRGYIHHFNSLDSNPSRVVETICAQVVGRFGLPYPQLPKKADERPGEFLREVLKEASKKLANAERLVIVVDALDEVKNADTSKPNLPFLPIALDKGVYFVVSTRPKTSLRLQTGHSKVFDFQDASHMTNNEKDARQYIRTWLTDAGVQQWIQRAECGPDDFIETVLAKSQANFMYLHHVLPAIADPQSMLWTFGVHELPQGLIDFYRRHWDEMQIDDRSLFQKLYEPVLCVLAAVTAPVSIDFISDVTNLECGHIQRALHDWRPFIYIRKGPLYRLYHASFKEFLSEEVDPGLRKYKAMIGNSGMRHLGACLGNPQPSLL